MKQTHINATASTPFVQLAVFAIKCGAASKTQVLPPEGDTIILTNYGNAIGDGIWVTLGGEGSAMPTAFYGVGYEVNGGGNLILTRPPGVKSLACIGKEPNSARIAPGEWTLHVEVGSRLAKPSAQPKPEPKPVEKGAKP